MFSFRYVLLYFQTLNAYIDLAYADCKKYFSFQEEAVQYSMGKRLRGLCC